MNTIAISKPSTVTYRTIKASDQWSLVQQCEELKSHGWQPIEGWFVSTNNNASIGFAQVMVKVEELPNHQEESKVPMAVALAATTKNPEYYAVGANDCCGLTKRINEKAKEGFTLYGNMVVAIEDESNVRGFYQMMVKGG